MTLELFFGIPPVETIRITSLTKEFLGRGINSKGQNLDFPYLLIGDEVQIEPVKRRPKSRSHKTIEIQRNTEWSDVRCEYFGECGGCVGQHLNYKTQLNLKFSPIQKLYLDHFGIELQEAPAQQIYEYRTRMDFSIFPGPKIGLRQRGNFRRIVSIEDCKIQSVKSNETLRETWALLREIPTIIWDRYAEDGGLKYVTIRKAQNTDEELLIFTFTEGYQSNELHSQLISLVAKMISCPNIVFCYNRKKSEVSCQGELFVVRGKSSYREHLFGRDFEIPFDSFFQPNPNGFLPILAFIQDYLADTTDSLIDLFCGSGFFSKLFGGGKQKIYGYEVTPSSIAEANLFFSKNFPNRETHFSVQNLFQNVEGLPKLKNGSLILDPPRSGAGALVCEWLKNEGPLEVFYVSCNPYSQWEDLKVILLSYDLIDGVITDPYPHTPHIETVVYLRRKTE